jgi:peptidyl-prolyl cis-trans isomerase B (cyclophilin B)
MDVVEKIKLTETTNRAGHSDVPVEPIVIDKAEISE